jgi:hypothetical protein
MELPNAKSIKELLEGLLGREIELRTADARLSPVDAVGSMVATYTDDDGKLAAILGWSMEAAAYVGSSLGLIPPGVAQEMVDERHLREDAAENLVEVTNIVAAALNRPGNPHVRLAQTYFPTSSAPLALTVFLFTHSDRSDIELDIKGYGVGQLALVACI